MYRQVIEFLYDWKQRKTRKPLIIRGARQVGKTYLVEQFAGEFEIFIKINFEKDVKFKSLFLTNDVKSILENIGLAEGKKIVPEKSLLFLDEIQAFPEAITTLRYFYEKIPELYVIAAGSLLDHVLN
ncbi:MAG: AAA family ATPase, partial [Bacteroidales bacterium]|nr:AAA family ATPase [Bacteroidales bacterium]